MKYQFIGVDYIDENDIEKTEKNKKEILSKYDEYQIEKLTFLNECYDSEATMLSYWTLYMANLHYDEVNKEKDLKYFTRNEIIILIKSIYGMDTTKASVGSFLSMYYRWADRRGDIGLNPFLGIKLSEIKTNPQLLLKSKLYGQPIFYKLCSDMEQNTKLPNIMPFILARYGIAGEKLYYMRHLRWEDIDEENYKVMIRTDDKERRLITTLDVDANFIKWINKARLYTESSDAELNMIDKGKKNKVRYSDYGYVLKKAIDQTSNESELDEDKVNKYNSIYTRANVACTSIDIKRIAFKDLVRSRQLELLLELRKQRRLNMSDFEMIIKQFDLDETKIYANKAFTLKKRYEELTGDKVVTDKDTIEENNENHLETANTLIQELGLEILS